MKITLHLPIDLDERDRADLRNLLVDALGQFRNWPEEWVTKTHPELTDPAMREERILLLDRRIELADKIRMGLATGKEPKITYEEGEP